MLSKRKDIHVHLLLGAICVAAFILRLGYLWGIKDDVLTRNLLIDAQFYDHWAKSILAGDWLGNSVYQQDPLYAYLLALIYKVFGPNPFAVRVVQAAADGVTCFFLYAIGRLLWNSKSGLISAALFGFYGVAICFSGLLDKTSFSTLFIAASLYVLVKAQIDQKTPLYLASGVLFGFSALIRGNVLIAFAFLWLGLLIQQFVKKKEPHAVIKSMGALAAGAALVIGLVSIRNYWVAHDRVLITPNSGISFYLGNRPEALGTFAAPSFVCTTPDCETESTKAIAEKALNRSSLKASEVSRYWFNLGVKEISRAPLSWIKILFQKIYWAFSDFELIETYSYYYFRDQSKILQLCFIGYGILFALGLMGFVLALRQSRQSLPILLFFLGYLISLLIFFVTSRHRFPLVIPLLLSAPLTLQAFWTYLQDRQWRPAIPLGAGLSIFLGISYARPSFFHVVTPNTLSTPYTHAAFIYRDQGNDDMAIQQIKKALDLRPESGWSWLLLGELLLRKQQETEAEIAFKKALQFDPRQGEAWNYLGKIYVQKKDYLQASNFFKKAMEVSSIPEDTKVYLHNYQYALHLIKNRP